MHGCEADDVGCCWEGSIGYLDVDNRFPGAGITFTREKPSTDIESTNLINQH